MRRRKLLPFWLALVSAIISIGYLLWAAAKEDPNAVPHILGLVCLAGPCIILLIALIVWFERRPR